MNKNDLIKAVSEAADLSSNQAEGAVKAVLDGITTSLKGGDKVTLVGFGTFSVNHRKAREGRNPSTGLTMQIPAKNVIKFKAGKALEDEVN
ncbi:MAG: DNA-binding protein HU [Legionellales bacterium]|nr:DNA-binding protein HU [Legionellales bacterium]|tara:strand:+ start:8076 stop:8348 length:273 start_codon:yes stop_codon:yes gene_type:complete